MIEYILFTVILLTRAIRIKNKYLNSLLDFSNYIALYFISTYTYTYIKTLGGQNTIQLLSYFVFLALLVHACRYFDKITLVFNDNFNDGISALVSMFIAFVFSLMVLYVNVPLFLLMWLVCIYTTERFYYN